MLSTHSKKLINQSIQMALSGSLCHVLLRSQFDNNYVFKILIIFSVILYFMVGLILSWERYFVTYATLLLVSCLCVALGILIGGISNF
jgi:hypothetical protein